MPSSIFPRLPLLPIFTAAGKQLLDSQMYCLTAGYLVSHSVFLLLQVRCGFSSLQKSENSPLSYSDKISNTIFFSNL